MHVDLDNLNTDIDDDAVDLSTLDRGDSVPEPKADEPKPDGGDAGGDGGDGEADKGDAGAKRDEKGRFVKDGAEGGAEGGEEEEEEEEEEEGEEEDEDAGKKGKSDKFRLRKALQQRDDARAAIEAERQRIADLEARLAALEKPAAKDEPKEDPADKINSQLDELYEKVELARADGDAKSAAQLQRQIDGLNRDLVTLEAKKNTVTLTAAQRETERFNTIIESMEAGDTRLVKGNDDYEPKTVARLNRMIVGLEASGMSPTAALIEASETVLGYDPTKPREPAKKKEEPKPKPEPKKTNVKDAIDKANRQPPEAGDRGVNKDDVKINVAQLSDEEYDKLPESTKAKLRGDFGA